MVGVRPIQASDESAVAALRSIAADERRAKRGGTQPNGLGETVIDDAAGERAEFVGTIGDAIVGVASLRRSGARATMDELFTHPGARGVGVGAAMLTESIDWARRHGCTDLDSFALPGDRSTKNFFESHAMKSRLLVVHCDLRTND